MTGRGGRGQALLKALSKLNLEESRPSSSISGPETLSGMASVQKHVSTNTSQESVLKPWDESIYKGKLGEPVPLSANYIKLLMNPTCETVYQHHVTFVPEVDSKSARFKILAQLAPILGSTYSFDGAILYLPKQVDKLITQQLTHPNGQPVAVTIKLTKTLHWDQCLALLNIILRRAIRHLGFTNLRRQYYSNKDAWQLEQLEIWPGYATTIKRMSTSLLLMVDVCYKVLRRDTVLERLNEHFDIARGDPERARQNVLAELLGHVVLTRYSNRTYRIDDIDWDMTPLSEFETKAGHRITFRDYYWQHYNIKIRDEHQPLLVSREKRKRDPNRPEGELFIVALVPELCYMTGLTDDERKDFNLMKSVHEFCRPTPRQRVDAVQRLVSRLSNTPESSAELSKWGLTLDAKPITLQGRRLPLETLVVGSQRGPVQLPLQRVDFTRDVTDNPVITPIHLNNWVLMCTTRDSNIASEFVELFCRTARSFGMNVNRPQVVRLPNDRTLAYTDAIRNNIRPDTQLVMSVMPNNREDRYSGVKRVCYVDQPVASQCVLTKTLSNQKRLKSVCQKIVLQVNAKLGGELWSLNFPVRNTMAIGIDTYHDATSGRKRSVFAFVASLNSNFSAWFSKVHLQAPGAELGESIRLCFIAALKAYHSHNHELPAHIFVLRDGVSDNQLKDSLDLEVPELEKCFVTCNLNNQQSYEPRLTFIVVQKRICTRFVQVGGNPGYQLRDGGGQHEFNPGPGTVVDHTVTRPHLYDFFLISQLVNQGTVNPTHYVVVKDTSGWPPDRIQKLTYQLTYMYYNWTGTVRVPAPCLYAHKLAFVVGQFLGQQPHDSLSDRLFYL